MSGNKMQPRYSPLDAEHQPQHQPAYGCSDGLNKERMYDLIMYV